MHLQHCHCHASEGYKAHDVFAWPVAYLGVYLAKSTYSRLCQAPTRSPTAACIWCSWAPLKCKIFVWLTTQYRLWTSDGHARHGLQDLPSACYTCLQDEDNVNHILVQCVYAREVWHTSFDTLQLNVLCPATTDTFTDWWLRPYKVSGDRISVDLIPW